MDGLTDEDKTLIQSVIDHLLYLSDKQGVIFRQEVQNACNHFHVNKKVNYDITKFKFPLHEHLH